MHRMAYAQEVASSAKTARDGEREIVQQSIELLELADKAGAKSWEATEAILFTRRLWTLFLEDLGRNENSLPAEIQANLISIGLWVLRQCDEIRLRKSNNFRGLIEVSKSIRDGLK